MRPFDPDGIAIQGRIIPKFNFGFPSAFDRTVLLHYGRQVGKTCDIAATYGVEYPFVRAVIAED